VLLKAAFPVDVRSSRAAYEIQFAAIERATHHNTDFDRARYEVVGHKWADLSEGDYGVSLLNDCKYGYDIKGNVMRLSLLRSPVDPDPLADEGEHRFTYALYPHAWDWRNGAVQQGYALNCPLLAVAVKGVRGRLPRAHAFATVDAENVIIDTVKRAEDSAALIVRLYEAYGQRGDVMLTFGRKPKHVTECDLMEENDKPVRTKGAAVRFFIRPFEIRTFKVMF
jgi:alpha-mannosidase